MGEHTHIEWCDHTFNPWRGCTHVSPGCEHCYAETLSARFGGRHGTWGASGERVIAAESAWRQPLRWNRDAERLGQRARVFCASLADVFEDRPDLVAPRERLWRLILDTPHLDWLLLTKRPENVGRLLGPRGLRFYAVEGPVPCPQPNVWIGTSVEDQRRADERIPPLLDTPAAVRFVSAEPLLGPVELDEWMPCTTCGGLVECHECGGAPGLDWLIVGGESGPGARPMNLAWARSLVAQGRAAGVPVFVKQLGARPVSGSGDAGCGISATSSSLRDRKGGDPKEWPSDLRVREFPA